MRDPASDVQSVTMARYGAAARVNRIARTMGSISAEASGQK